MIKRLKGILTVLALLAIAALALAWFLGFFDTGDANPRVPASHQAPPPPEQSTTGNHPSRT